MPLQVKRVREAAHPADGTRFLVDGLWPRALSRDRVQAESWLKALAPSAELRRWYGHNRDRWTGFQTRYAAELTAKPGAWSALLAAAQRETVTLLTDTKDLQHSNAEALRQFLDARL